VPSLDPLRAVLSNRQFTLLWGGQTVSQFGDGIVAVALPLLVLQTTGSAVDLGLVVAARLVPTVCFLLLGGAVTDRVSRRLAMLVSDASRAVITAALGLLALSGVLTFTELVVGSLLFGTFDALFYPSSSALYPELINAELLIQATSLRQSSGTIAAGLLGPVVGGIIASTIGTSWSLLIDAGTFVVSAGCLLAMRATPRPAPTGASVLADIAAGIRFCRQTSWIAWTLIVAAFANAIVFMPVAVLLPLLFKRTLHSPDWMVGVGFAAFGVGSLIGALLLAFLPRPRRRVRTMWTLWTAASFLTVGYGIAPSAWTAALALLAIGPLLMGGQVIWESLLQAEVPREMLGRVSSVDFMVSFALAPIGVAVAGVAAGVVGIRFAIVFPALVVGAFSLTILLVVRSLTALDREPPAVAAA
jgi:DHA3 family tetracycline resistance protein-like MFS transporter